MSTKNILKFTDETNAIDYLNRAYSFISETKVDTTAWKWVVIAVHGALYGFAVSASKNTDKSTSTNKRGYVITLDKALKQCQNPKHMAMLTSSKHIELTDSQKESIRILKKVLRNSFEHFSPKLWVIELDGIANICVDVLNVIRFLALETNTYITLSLEQKNHIDQTIDECIDMLKKSELYQSHNAI